MKNSTVSGRPKMCTNGVYKFICPEMCQSLNENYIGHTTTTLRRRMLAHRNQGAIHQHCIDVHDRKPSLEGTQVVHFGRLLVADALRIAIQKPTLNIQQESDHILPSSRRRNARANRDQTARPQPPDAPSPQRRPSNVLSQVAEAPPDTNLQPLINAETFGAHIRS